MRKVGLLLLLLTLSALPTLADEAQMPIPACEQNWSPGVAGILSFFVPGAGHFYCEEYRSGTLYLAGTSFLLAGMAFALEDTIDDQGQGSIGLFFALGGAALTLHAVDVVHAIRTAKAKSHRVEFGLGPGPRGQAALLVTVGF